MVCFVLSNSSQESTFKVQKSFDNFDGFSTEDFMFVDSDDSTIICSEIKEYQQVQSAGSGDLHSSSTDDSCSSDTDIEINDGCRGNIEDSSEDEVNEVAKVNSVGERDDSVTPALQQAIEDAEDEANTNVSYMSDGIEDIPNCVEIDRHPRDPTLATGEEDFQETGYMAESKLSKSCIGIKHSRSKSVLLHLDALKMLSVTFGVRANVETDVSCSEALHEALRREYVRDSNLVHEDVFDELQLCFPDASQLHRLLMLDNITEWDGWSHIKDLLANAQSDNMKRLHIHGFVYSFIKRCQIICLHEEFPTDVEYRKNG